MTFGFVMLAHTALDRAAQVAETISGEGCPVVVHIDKRARRSEFDAFAERIAPLPGITLARRFRCDWGTWSLVEATRQAAEQLLRQSPALRHVMLVSGACLPIKPVAELKAYLDDHAGVDFIESVTVEDVPWTVGGLSEERFSLSFPFAWKRHRLLFDIWVEAQRRIGRRRRLPVGLKPHLGSQWWCLSRGTLERILNDPDRASLDRFFRRVWIPDESYFQSLVRYHGAEVESRSLTLSSFDFQGKPHVFYDDQLGMLADSPAFFARKIWPGATRLYEAFLSGEPVRRPASTATPGSFASRIFGEAVAQRTEGRPGLAMVGRFPREGFENSVTAVPYAVFHGFGEVFSNFPDWIRRETGSCAHGNLYGPKRAEFADRETMWAGALSDSAALRDHDPEAFLRNLIWNTRGEHQSFLLSPQDNLDIGPMLARDRNAVVFAVTGAWMAPLLFAGRTANDIRGEAARLQSREAAFLGRLRERRCLATCRVWSLADLLERPSEPLQQILDDLTGAKTRALGDLPVFRSMTGLAALLQDLRNAGMNPYLAGEVAGLLLPVDEVALGNVVRIR